jgi:NDP-sugar pyrophosphorylase family protein
MSRRAVILAGGKGTRLRPYTIVLPKPLMPVGDYPILEIVVRQLVSHGFDHLTMAVNHQAELIKAFFGDGGKWKVRIDYSLEDRELSTMGPLKLIPDLPENFLVMNGDILTDLDYSGFFESHVEQVNCFTISSYEREHQVDYGVLATDGTGRLSGFQEKPINRYEVSMGIYMLNRGVVDRIPADRAYGFDHLMKDLLSANERVNVKRFSGYWLDIGRAEDYARAVDEFTGMKERFLRPQPSR